MFGTELARHRPKLGAASTPVSGRWLPTSSECRPALAKIGTHLRPKSHEGRRIRAEFGRTRAGKRSTSGQICPNSGRCRPKSAKFGPESTGPAFAEVGPKASAGCPESSTIHQIWAAFGRFGGRCRISSAKSARNRPSLDRFRLNLDTDVDHVRPNSAEIGEFGRRLGQRSACIPTSYAGDILERRSTQKSCSTVVVPSVAAL